MQNNKTGYGTSSHKWKLIQMFLVSSKKMSKHPFQWTALSEWNILRCLIYLDSIIGEDKESAKRI
jgi:hypothetical protein